MMKKKKIIAILIITILFFSSNFKTVYAGGCVPAPNPPSSGGGDPSNNSNGDGGPGCSLGETVDCGIADAGSLEGVNLEEDVYDENNNFIGKAALLTYEQRFMAGRFVGIDAYEKYQKTYYVTINPSCIKGELRTEVIGYIHLNCDTNNDMSDGYEDDCYEPIYGEVLYCVPCYVPVSRCRPEADAKLDSLARNTDLNPSYFAKRQDVNDINEGIDKQNNPTIDVPISDYDYDLGHSEPADPNSSTVWQTVTMTATYNLTSAWVDPLTGNVKYEAPTQLTWKDPKGNLKTRSVSDVGQTITEKEKSTYIKVPDMYTIRDKKRVKLGNYFMPLNAKSTDLLRYYLIPDVSRSVISINVCSALIDQNNEKVPTKEYWGDFLADKHGNPMSERARTVSEAKAIIAREGGCRMGLYVSFYIKQGFYHEPDDDCTNPPCDPNPKTKLELSGYDYYYRPIDYTNPFPNGLLTDGIWRGIYNNTSNSITIPNAAGQKLDLDESFDEVTYYTDDGYNLTKIRNFNSIEGNYYTNWTGIKQGDNNKLFGMKDNGTSSFISSTYGVTRAHCQTYYALGCGPENANWEECKQRKTEVCK